MIIVVEIFGMEVNLHLKVDNLKSITDKVKGALDNVPTNINAQIKGMASGATGGIFGDAEGGGFGKMLGTMALGITVLGQIKKGIDSIVGELSKSSPYLQGILSVFERVWMNVLRPFGDFLATMLKPLAVNLLRLSVQWLQFSRSPTGQLVSSNVVDQLLGPFNSLVLKIPKIIESKMIGNVVIPELLKSYILSPIGSFSIWLSEFVTGTVDMSGWLTQFIINPIQNFSTWLGGFILNPIQDFATWLWDKLTNPFGGTAENQNTSVVGSGLSGRQLQDVAKRGTLFPNTGLEKFGVSNKFVFNNAKFSSGFDFETQMERAKRLSKQNSSRTGYGPG